MKQAVKISYTLLIIFFTNGCSTNVVSDEVEILSLIFNSQIGDYEHFGSSPPAPPLPPSFDELERYSSLDSAKLNLISIEWQQYFKQEEEYDKIVELWKIRMQNIEKKIVFFNKCRLSAQDKIWVIEEIKKYEIDSNFLNKPINWKISDIKNNSKYELIEYKIFKDSKLDTVHVGIMKFSNIGFNNEKNLAIVYFDWLCGSLCGDGNLAILEKKANIWKIKEIVNLWIS
ncbi:MAG: hypothetical protein H6570_16855 [Lewinellaceae bacterium]|nr:hypothetical protein [Lewinellaceae bacterium]